MNTEDIILIYEDSEGEHWTQMCSEIVDSGTLQDEEGEDMNLIGWSFYPGPVEDPNPETVGDIVSEIRERVVEMIGSPYQDEIADEIMELTDRLDKYSEIS